MGALHPILFFFVVYGIALFMAFFVCRTIYYSINEEQGSVSTELTAQQDAKAVAYR